jgi:hypothetical protein
MSGHPKSDFAVVNLGSISENSAHKTKFILLDDGVLLFGKVEWHKDLAANYTRNASEVSVVAAGTVPNDIAAADLSEESWGGWKSTGYDVRTPIEFRESIRTALLPYKEEIERLSK